MIFLEATQNRLRVTNREMLTAGTVNVNQCRFDFSSDWDGLTRTAVFRCGEASVSVALDDTNTCAIPWEVLATPNRGLQAGVYGAQGEDVVLPTIWASLGTVLEGTKMGDNANQPTPDVYQQILAQIEAGKLKGDKGDKGETGETGAPGLDGIAVETSGMWGFAIKDGDLICAYSGGEAPNLQIKSDGNLYLTL
jgi:hypothetical protein